MKKIMLTLLCAGAMSAVVAATLTGKSVTTFAGYNDGDSFSASSAVENEKYYWYSADAQSGEIAVRESANLALAIDAENPLYRTAEGSAAAYADAESFAPVDAGDGFAVDTLIKFESSRDSDEEIPDGSAKLAVWLNASSNLVIAAGKTENGTFTTNKYETAATYDPEVWHQLTVRSFIDNNVMKFKVYVDGTQVGAGEDFESLQPEAAATLSAVAFQGSGSVDDITFVQNVAKIGDTYYETFADAVAAASASDVIDLLATCAETITLTGNKTLKYRSNDNFTGSVVAGVETVLSSVEDDGVTTYTSAEGVASCNGVWYPTFAEAYAAAVAYDRGGHNPTMVVKIDADFTPSISDTVAHFYSLEFKTSSDNAMSINLANDAGTAYMKSSRYYFPTNATLTLAADLSLSANDSVRGGTLNIPADKKVAMTSYLALNNVTNIVGEGRIVPSAAACAYLLQYPNNVLPTSLRSTGWKGTLEVSGAYTSNYDFSNFGNTESSIAFNSYTGYVHSVQTVTSVGTIEIINGGLTLNGDYGGDRTFMFENTVKGSGPLYVDVKDASTSGLKTVQFTGDVLDFAGDVTIDSSCNCRVVFGTQDIVGNGTCVVIGSDASVLIADGATWTAPNGFVIKGTMTVDGELSTTQPLYGTGVVRFNNASDISVAGTWTGTYVIGWAGSNSTRIDFDSYATANSRIEIPADSTLQGYIGSAQGGTYNLAAKEVIVNGVLNLSNGYNTSTVVWKKISGSGTVKYSFRPSTAIYEQITVLDGFTGSIEVSATTQLAIGTVNVATAPAEGACIVPMTVTSGGTVGGDLNFTVAGEPAGTLEYRADAAQPGLYVHVPTYVAYIDVAETTNYYETVTEAIAGTLSFSRVITLLANVDEAYVMDPEAARPLKVKLNGFTWTGLTAPAGYRVVANYIEATQTTQYSCVEDAPVAARIGTTEGQGEYASVDAALEAVLANNMSAGTVVYVLDEGYVRSSTSALLQQYFTWNGTSSPRTWTRKATITGEGDQTVTATTGPEACNNVVILPTGQVVSDALQGAPYESYFTKAAVDNGNGTWTVTATLNKSAILSDVQTDIISGAVSETETMTTLLAGAMNSEAETITVSAKNGLYYSIKSGTEPNNLTEGSRVLATSGSVTLPKPTGSFFRISVNTAPAPVE